MMAKTILFTTNVALLFVSSALGDIVTFTGSGTGPFTGSFEDGTVAATASGPNIVAGSVVGSPNSNVFPFATDQIIGITDVGETGAVVTFAFSGVTFGDNDFFFVTSVGGESDIVISARAAGFDIDVDWNVFEAVGQPLAFDDDGAGLNATISGTPNQPGGLLLQPTVSGIDQLVVSWTGNGSSNRGLQLGLVAVPEPSSVVGSFVSHGGWSGGGSAIDTGKLLAKEGVGQGELTYDNLINTSRGLNGLAFDIQDLANAAGLSEADFQFQVSPPGAFSQAANPPTEWESAPAPSSLVVTAGSPDRVLITWPDSTIANRWLRITVKANGNTGLAAPAVYYIGHLLGETTGPENGVFTVSFADITPIRAEVGQTVDVTSIADVDKNGTASFADISAMRGNVGVQLRQITVP